MLLSSLPKNIIAALMVVILAVSVTGCARRDTGSQSQATASTVTVKGSDTMVHLVSTWAEQFMQQHPDIQVSVTGGGSGTGIAALLNGTTDIAASSRDLKEEEEKLAEQKGISLGEVTVGQDGLAVVVHPGNPVKELTMDQIKDIFTGKITNWKTLGGPDQPILVYSRESSSGTYAFFQEHVLKKQDYAQSARLMPATSAITEAVSSDKGGIGYVGLGYAAEAGNKVLTIGVKADAQSKAVMPSAETVLNGSYPIARSLYLYLPGKATPAAKQFADFTVSPEGQKTVEEAGYIPNPGDKT